MVKRSREYDTEAGFPRLNQRGAAGWAFLWLLGIPIPVLLAFFLLRGCT